MDRTIAEAIQLRLEYNAAPPFQSGDSAPPEVLALIQSRMAPFRLRRAEDVVRAAARLNEPASGLPALGTEKGRLASQATFPVSRQLHISRGDFGLMVRGPISRPCPARQPLHLGTVAILEPDPTRWFPISVR